MRSKILEALAINEEETTSIRDIAVYDDWFVLGLQTETAASPPTAITQRPASESTKSLGGSVVLKSRSERP